MIAISIKIIISNKCKEHMKSHESEFLYEWEELLNIVMKEGKLNELNKDFEIVTIDFSYDIGYCTLIETKKDDEVIYAKRINRDIYSRFVKDKKIENVKSIVVILNKNRKRLNEYYLVTMFPGGKSQKEPEDMNIKSREELIECLEFWESHALVYDESIIQKDSIKSNCPYKNLYFAVA